MDLRKFHYALTVAEELHFGRAAARLHVAQPSLSRQIRELEAELGTALFDRTSRSVTLTPAGAAFLRPADAALKAAEKAKATAHAAALGVSGHATLGFVASAAIEAIPPIIRAHRERRPQVALTLREMSTTAGLDALHADDIDVGLVRDVVPSDGTRITTLYQEPLLAAVPEGHPLAHRTGINLRELGNADIVALPQSYAPRTWSLLGSLAHENGIRFNVVQEAEQYATLLALVAAGVGAAVAPRSVRALRRDDVHYLELEEPRATSAVQAITRAERTTPVTRELYDLLVELLLQTDETATAL